MRANPNQFRAFAHVVREGSVSAAARRLGVSQSAVTQHIAKLEAAIGSRLFIRAKAGITLTRAGQEFFDLADRLITLNTVIEEKLQGYAELGAGELTIIANAPQPALRLIGAYSALYPDVKINFTLYDWTTAMDLLRSQQVDVGIITEPTPQPDWYIDEIISAPYVLYARMDDPLAAAGQVSLRDLVARVVILPEAGSFTQRTVREVLAREGLALRRTLRTTTFPVMKEAILEGIGVGIFLAKSTVGEARLVERPIAEMPARHRTFVVVPNYKLDLQLIRSFVAITKGRAAAAPKKDLAHVDF